MSNTVLTGKFRKFSPIAKIFRQIDLQYNSLVKKLIWRNFCKISLGNHLQISTILCYHTKKISWNQFFSNFFSKALIWWKNADLPEKSFYCTFPHCGFKSVELDFRTEKRNIY